MTPSVTIAITSGDHRGIGPEIIAKGLYALRKKFPNSFQWNQFLIFGDPKLYRPFQKFLTKNQVCWNEQALFDLQARPLKKGTLHFILPQATGKIASIRDAYLSGRYIELATQAALRGIVSGIVTGPIDKSELQRGGYDYDGHTEMLQSLCATHYNLSPKKLPVTMMLASPRMRVSLVTTHVPLSRVSEVLTKERVLQTIRNTHNGLLRYFAKPSPKIAILGLNPHAGDHGLFGTEEADCIIPALNAARSEGISVSGPFPADGFFSQWRSRHQKAFDAVVCMYHDQGLIPVKLFDFKNTVNITLGLPLIRTSVDHGTGLDIAGKNIADPSSFLAALQLARKIVTRQKSI